MGSVLNARGTAAYATPGFVRFTKAHAIAAAGDAFVTVSLAGSLFFSVSPDASRRQVLIYLVVTMAPFALLAPLIGPTIDRFRRGHRWIAVLLYLNRAALSIALAFTLFTLLFYPIALALLVANKASGVLKSALVPGLVGDTSHLVAANSRLARVSTIVGGSGGAIAAGISGIANSTVVLYGAAVLFTGAAVLAFGLPRPRTAEEIEEGHLHDLLDEGRNAEELEFQDVHRPLIAVSATAYTVIRFAVGAFVFGLAFALRRASEPAWMYGAALVGYGAGAYLGNVVAPLARRRYGEDRLLAGALIGLAVCAAFAAAGGSRILIIVVATMMGAATTFGRQGFDSLVQRQAPRALHGRSFARFETQFQLGWVAGAAFATAAAVPTRISLTVLAGVLIPASVIYMRSAAEAQRFAPAEPPDHLESAIAGHLDAADVWIARERPRLAAISAITAVELRLAAGAPMPGDLMDELAVLRDLALDPHSDLPPDHVVSFMDRARLALLGDHGNLPPPVVDT